MMISFLHEAPTMSGFASYASPHDTFNRVGNRVRLPTEEEKREYWISGRKTYTTPIRDSRKHKAQRPGWAKYLICLVAGEECEPSRGRNAAEDACGRAARRARRRVEVRYESKE